MNLPGPTDPSQHLRDWQPVLRLADQVIGTVLDRITTSRDSGRLEDALQWAQMLSGFIVFGGNFGRLASQELERVTAEIAPTLPIPAARTAPAGPRRFLHVFTEAYELFGHSKLCRQWIELDVSGSRHDVVCLSQYGAAPENLRQSVAAVGGRLSLLQYGAPLLEKAARLRRLAYADADVVVLHVHPNEILTNVAFGVPGGPPVVYVNHADHEFWVGGASADLVLDIRESGQAWTRFHRGIPRTQILPIPLDEDPMLRSDRAAWLALREKTRGELGIRADEQMLLTVGSARKYWPLQGISFLEAADAILAQNHKARIVAVGPTLTGDWKSLSERMGGRLMALGNQSGLGRFHAAADLYLEGMPAGSLTALLEACLAGVACVRSPAQVRPPHASDGTALLNVAQPADLPAYVAEASELIWDEAKRQARGNGLREAVRATHCQTGWSKRLAEIIANLPQEHLVYSGQIPQPIERQDVAYRLEYAYRDLRSGLAGVISTAVKQAVRSSQLARDAVEQVLPSCCLGNDSASGVKLLAAILPELAEVLVGVGADAPVKSADLAGELVREAVERGRNKAAWQLAVRLSPRQPGVWSNPHFLRGMAKSLPGMARLVASKKGARI